MLAALAALVVWLGSGACRAEEAVPFVVVDTRALTLTVLSAENRPLARFRNIALGRGGVAAGHVAGNAATPRGTYHVAWINPESRFGIFFGFDYPTPEDAARGLAAGTIDRDAFDAIWSAHREHRRPPQDTALGGQIGIHGIGRGDPAVQRRINWTDGCIALPNAEAQALRRWVRVGTTVIVR